MTRSEAKDPRVRLSALMNALADHVEGVSDQELLDDALAQDIDSKAEATRIGAFLLDAVLSAKKERLRKASAAHGQAVVDIGLGAARGLPEHPDARRTVIGVDPGKSPGLAVWCLSEGVPTCLYASPRHRKPLTPHQQREAFRTALDTCRAIGGVDLCVVESQYQGPSVKTLISLAHDAGQWRAIAELEGVRTLWCSPREWQAHLGLKGLRAVIACELDIALDKLGCHARAADAASACGLALWGLAHPFGCEAEREEAAIERARKKVAKADKKKAKAKGVKP